MRSGVKGDLVKLISIGRLTALLILILPGYLLCQQGEEGQEWVISYDIQKHNDFFWDGKHVRALVDLEEEYDELKCFQTMHGLSTNIFMIDGHFCTDFHLQQFSPDTYALFVEIRTKLRSLESAESLSLSSAELSALKAEIRRIQAALPPQMDFDNYLWFCYCRGIEKDFEEGLILPQEDCLKCKGMGKFPCRLCDGDGKVGFFNPSIDVIDSESNTRKEYRRMERARYKTKGGDDRSIREEILQEKEDEKQKKLKERQERMKRNEEIECAICKGRGWCACPGCVLVNRPRYNSSVKVKYMPRWSRLKSENWR